jgi:outer membrane protein OmpA-like peptidoglycan-associated protein
MRATLLLVLLSFASPVLAGKGGDLGEDSFVEHAKADALDVIAVVHFESRRWDLSARDRVVLDKVVERLAQEPALKVELAGHADSTGAESFNQSLSEHRALAVGHYLQRHGVDTQRLTVMGYGMFLPAASNDTEAGRARNRRAEVKISP